MALVSSRDLIFGDKRPGSDAQYCELWEGAWMWEGGERGTAVG